MYEQLTLECCQIKKLPNTNKDVGSGQYNWFIYSNNVPLKHKLTKQASAEMNEIFVYIYNIYDNSTKKPLMTSMKLHTWIKIFQKHIDGISKF